MWIKNPIFSDHAKFETNMIREEFTSYIRVANFFARHVVLALHAPKAIKEAQKSHHCRRI